MTHFISRLLSSPFWVRLENCGPFLTHWEEDLSPMRLENCLRRAACCLCTKKQISFPYKNFPLKDFQQALFATKHGSKLGKTILTME